MEVERFAIEQALKRPKGVEMIENPHILKKSSQTKHKEEHSPCRHNKPFSGVFLAFLLEYKDIKQKSS